MKRKINYIWMFFGLLCFISAGFKQSFEKNQFKPNTDSTIVYDQSTGLVIDEGLALVRAHCTGCHSAKIITQFRADKTGWLEKIRWMQQKQNLWDLADAEPEILTYLAKNYPKTNKTNRREHLKVTHWYKYNKQQ